MSKNCENCINYSKVNFLGKETYCCLANVSYPDKCVLGKARKTLKDLSTAIFDENGNFKSNWALVIPIVLYILSGFVQCI